jgi:hypothetical protein
MSVIKEELVLASNPYLQQFEDVRLATIAQFTALDTTTALRELRASIKPLWASASASARIKKPGARYFSRCTLIEKEHSKAVKDHVERLVKSTAKDKQQQRASLLEGLILLKQLQMYTINPPDLSPVGCVPAWYQ